LLVARNSRRIVVGVVESRVAHLALFENSLQPVNERVVTTLLYDPRRDGEEYGEPIEGDLENIFYGAKSLLEQYPDDRKREVAVMLVVDGGLSDKRQRVLCRGGSLPAYWHNLSLSSCELAVTTGGMTQHLNVTIYLRTRAEVEAAIAKALLGKITPTNRELLSGQFAHLVGALI
jgi:hypothetical protein